MKLSRPNWDHRITDAIMLHNQEDCKTRLDEIKRGKTICKDDLNFALFLADYYFNAHTFSILFEDPFFRSQANSELLDLIYERSTFNFNVYWACFQNQSSWVFQALETGAIGTITYYTMSRILNLPWSANVRYVSEKYLDYIQTDAFKAQGLGIANINNILFNVVSYEENTDLLKKIMSAAKSYKVNLDFTTLIYSGIGSKNHEFVAKVFDIAKIFKIDLPIDCIIYHMVKQEENRMLAFAYDYLNSRPDLKSCYGNLMNGNLITLRNQFRLTTADTPPTCLGCVSIEPLERTTNTCQSFTEPGRKA